MHLLKVSSFFLINLLLISCGGGGGSGGSSDTSYSNNSTGNTTSNSMPSINNSTEIYEVNENQTTAFSVNADDPDGDSLTFSLSGDDGSLFSISGSGVVNFIEVSDYDNPSDINADNSYQLTVSVSDGTATVSKDFTVVVNNVFDGFSGQIIYGNKVQGATVCFESILDSGCDGIVNSVTSAQDGTFSLEVSDSTEGTLVAQGGFDPSTNQNFDSLSVRMSLKDPVRDESLVVSPLSTLVEKNQNSSYQGIKEHLGIDNTFMIRFNDPYSNLDSAAFKKVAKIDNQLFILIEALKSIDPKETEDVLTDSVEYKISNALTNRTGSETSLGDTTFIKKMIESWGFDNFTLTNAILENLSAGLSSYLQKIYIDEVSQLHNEMTKVGTSELQTTLSKIVDGTIDQTELDSLFFDTLTYIENKGSLVSNSLLDVEENINKTSYTVSNNGSSYYSVDGVNADSTALIIYARVGDTIKFDPLNSSVFAAHPFEISTSRDDTSGANNIGSSQGWNQTTYTLEVGVNTPKILYPHCGVHSGMYTNGKIEIVNNYEQDKIDITSGSLGLEVNGTVSVGPYKGASGITHKVYLRTEDAGSSQHAHEFKEYPGLTFYMPADQGYHGASSSSGEVRFKPKSHFSE